MAWVDLTKKTAILYYPLDTSSIALGFSTLPCDSITFNYYCVSSGRSVQTFLFSSPWLLFLKFRPSCSPGHFDPGSWTPSDRSTLHSEGRGQVRAEHRGPRKEVSWVAPHCLLIYTIVDRTQEGWSRDFRHPTDTSEDRWGQGSCMIREDFGDNYLSKESPSRTLQGKDRPDSETVQ